MYFLISIRRHTRCALVTGVHTAALPVSSPSSSANSPFDSATTPPNRFWMLLALRTCIDRALPLTCGRPRPPTGLGAGRRPAARARLLPPFIRKGVVAGRIVLASLSIVCRRIFKKHNHIFFLSFLL